MAGLSIVLSNNPSLSLRFHRNGALSWSSAEQSTEKEGAGEQRSREQGSRGEEEQGSRGAESRRAWEKKIAVKEQRAEHSTEKQRRVDCTLHIVDLVPSRHE